MEYMAMIMFGVSLVLVIALFVLKAFEKRRNARIAESLRVHADAGALHLKGLLLVAYDYFEQTPWFIGALTRWGVHVGALGFARIARKSAEYAHALADFVSHKRGFERKETKSRYLKEVSEYKNGGTKTDTQV